MLHGVFSVEALGALLAEGMGFGGACGVLTCSSHTSRRVVRFYTTVLTIAAVHADTTSPPAAHFLADQMTEEGPVLLVHFRQVRRCLPE